MTQSSKLLMIQVDCAFDFVFLDVLGGDGTLGMKVQ